MLYTSKFSDKNGKVYSIQIHTGTNTVEVPVTMSGSPCIINVVSDGLFSPIKSRQCTLEIVSDRYYMDLYQTSSRGAKCTIKDESNNSIIFFGYLSNNVYNQDYTYLDTIQIEVREAISTLQDYRFTTESTFPKYQSMSSIVIDMIKECGYTGTVYFPNAYNLLNDKPVNDILSQLYVSEANFFDDTEEHKPWTKYEVLEEIMKFMNWSLCPYGNDIYIVDYRALGNSNTVSYSEYSLTDNTVSIESITKVPIELNISNIAPGTPDLTMDDVFNKIELSDNLYEIDEIAPDIDDNVLEDVIIPGGTTITLDESQWVKTTVTKHWLRADEVSTDVTGYEYQTVQLFKPESGWTHHFYEKDLLVEVDNQGQYSNCYDRGSRTQYVSGPINKYINTIGCVLQHYAYRENNGPSNLPTSLDWTDYLTFFITDDTTGTITLTNTARFELPVLEYEVAEEVMWKPSSGTSWITIKGDLFYQYNGAKYGEKNKQKLNIINENSKYYTTAPVDKASEIDEQKYVSCYRDYDHYKNTGYGTGFSAWKMKLQVGDKYWNGNGWVSNESTFYLKYNNNPSNREDEYFPAFSWASIVPNTDYTDKVGENCYAVPIRWNDNNAPTFGKLKLTVYVPRLIPEEIVSLFTQVFRNDVQLDWKNLPPVIYAKDFELNYIYTDTSKWYSAKKNENDSDVVYTNIINDSNTNEFDSLELKINTQLQDRPISRSYVCTANGYLKTMKHTNGDESKEQEKNCIDAYYWHHNQPKKIYSCNTHIEMKPNDIMTATAIDGRYLLDKYTWDVRNTNLNISLIEY